ncbi:MAG: hypothetical protein FWF23_06285 [Alphaproteobacteria bacterium]|nr:hypothetical protein [Alphaproteobacteria bacterium]MCL2505712.1 hypothetical protein [Alphaproteobacteria bacterium]
MLENNEEKIVLLATELLKNNAHRRQSVFPKKRVGNLSLNMVTIFMTAFVTTAVCYYVDAYGHHSDRPLNRYEKIEMQALIFYASKIKNLNESMIQYEVELLVGASIDKMNVKDFPAARSFLQDIIKPN